MGAPYRRIEGSILRRDTRDVVVVKNAAGIESVHFRCPCNLRRVYIASPPHTITFDDAGLLTLDGSCGFTAKNDFPDNWCHFVVKNGEPEMCSDAACPGGKG